MLLWRLTFFEALRASQSKGCHEANRQIVGRRVVIDAGEVGVVMGRALNVAKHFTAGFSTALVTAGTLHLLCLPQQIMYDL